MSLVWSMPNQFDIHYEELRRGYRWKLPRACQFHSENTDCEPDEAFSMEVIAEKDYTILTKTDDYFLLQQSLMEERKDELASLLLLSGPTKRAFTQNASTDMDFSSRSC